MRRVSAFALGFALLAPPAMAQTTFNFSDMVTQAPPATVPFGTADRLPIVQGGQTHSVAPTALGGGGGADIRQFGCVLDGSTDDTTCAQAAVAWLKSTGGPLWMPANKTMAISQTLDISASNWRWQCLTGYATTHNIAPSSGSGSCVIKWIGGTPASGYMITDIAPTGSTTNQSLQGQHLIGLTLNGNGIAGGGVHVATVKDSEFGQIYCTGFNGGTGPGSKPCVNFDVVHSTSTNFGEGCDNLRLNIYDITGYQVGFTSDIVQYNAWINTGIPNSGCGNSYNTITRISGLVQNSDIFAQYGGDNNRTVGMSGAVVSGTGRMLYVGVASNIDPGTGLTKVNGTNSEIYDHISIGPIVVAGTATGCAITPGVLGMCPTGLQFRNLDASNGAGNPTLGAGIRPMVDVIWDFNNNTAQPWAAWAPTLTCESGSPGSYTVSGANFFKRGGTVSFSVRLTLGTLTGCTGGQVLTAPPGAAITNLTGNLSGTISCYDFNNGAVGTGYIDGGTNLIHTRWAGVQPGSNDIIGCGGVYASN